MSIYERLGGDQSEVANYNFDRTVPNSGRTMDNFEAESALLSPINKAFSRIFFQLRSFSATDPRRESHLTDQIHQIPSAPSVVDGESVDVHIILSGGITPDESREVSIYINGSKSYLVVNQEGGTMRVIGESEPSEPTEDHLLYYQRLTKGIIGDDDQVSNPT